MIERIKEYLVKNPESLCNLLESFGYCHFKLHGNYLSFGRDQNSSPKSIVVYLENNPHCYVRDYAANLNCDVFKFIITSRGVSFREVISEAQRATGLSYEYYEKPKIFGGFYESIRGSHEDPELKVLDESVLDKYCDVPNLRFVRDRIDAKTMKFYRIGFDVENQAITIPIRDEIGQLIGVKARANDNDAQCKYFYLYPTLITQTLYSFSENYGSLENDLVVIFESEKSCMQCRTFGFYNAVAMGSSELSDKQVRLIMSLNPKKVILAHDKSSQREAIKGNLKKLLQYRKYREFELGYVDMEKDDEVPEKASPSDLGKEKFYEILNNEVIIYKEKENE